MDYVPCDVTLVLLMDFVDFFEVYFSRVMRLVNYLRTFFSFLGQFPFPRK